MFDVVCANARAHERHSQMNGMTEAGKNDQNNNFVCVWESWKRNSREFVWQWQPMYNLTATSKHLEVVGAALKFNLQELLLLLLCASCFVPFQSIPRDLTGKKKLDGRAHIVKSLPKRTTLITNTGSLPIIPSLSILLHNIRHSSSVACRLTCLRSTDHMLSGIIRWLDERKKNIYKIAKELK